MEDTVSMDDLDLPHKITPGEIILKQHQTIINQQWTFMLAALIICLIWGIFVYTMHEDDIKLIDGEPKTITHHQVCYFNGTQYYCNQLD